MRFSKLDCVTSFVYVLGLSSSPLGVPKVPLRTPANDRFLPRLSSDLGGVWLFRIHCQEAAVLRLSKLGCVTFFVYVLGLSSSPLGVPKVPLRTPANDRFLPRLSSDLGGVWLFRIHCQEAAVLRLSKLGCVTFFVYVLGLSSSPLGVPKVPLRTPANDRFLPRLSSDLPGGVGNQKFLVAAKNQKKKSENQFFGFASWRPAFLHFSLHTSYIAQFVYRNCTRNVHYKKDMIIHVFFVYICVA